MSAVSILDDPYGVVDDGDVVVRTQPDLILALAEIESASIEQTDLVVLLRNPALGRSLLTHMERLPGVRIEQLHPARSLAAALGVGMSELPRPVLEDPRFIVQSGLLDRVDELNAVMSHGVARAIVSVLVGSEWASAGAPSDVRWVADIIGSLARFTPGAGTLQLIQSEVLQDWSAMPHAHPAVRVLSASSDLHQLSRAFMCAAALRGYPTHLRLKTTAVLLEQAQDVGLDETLLAALVEAWSSGPVPVPASTAREAEQYVEQQLEAVGLAGVTDSVGGMLDSESRAIERHMRGCGRLSDEEESVARRIAASMYRHGLADAARRVTDLIPPAGPKLDCPDTDWAEISDWVTGEYLPYYEWATSSGSLADLSESLDGWEQWVVREYADSTWDPERYSPLAVSKALREFTEVGVPVCLVVVDAMSWSGAMHLQAGIHGRSGQLLEITPGLAAVPTVTSVAKPAVVRGQKPDQVVLSECAESDYLALFRENLGLPHDRVAMARSNDSTLADLLAHKADAYVYFFDSLDLLVHQPLSSSIRRRQMQSALNGLADDIAASREDYLLRTGRHIALVVCSDHGYTELPDNSEVVEVSSQDVVDHSRVLRSKNPPEKSLGIAEITQTPFTDDVFVAAGLTCFGSRPKGAAHGGLSPQELVVAIGVMDPSQELGDFKRVAFVLDGEARRGRSDNPITLHVSNENPADVSLQYLDVRLARIQYEPPLLLPAGRGLQFSGSIDASSVTAEELEVTIDAKVEYLGQTHEQRTVVRVATSGAATSDSAFEDDFDV